MTGVEFRVLGPIEAIRAGTRLSLGGPRPRAVLAVLLLRHGHWVSVDTLIDGVWGEAPPVTAAKTVQKYVSHLRAALGDPDLIVSRPEGYELAAPDVDSRQFDLLIDRAAAAPYAVEAADLLTQALTLWRGEPYADLPELVPAQAERRRLHERRLEAIESLVDIRLALGEHTALVSWLEELVTEHPLRERLWGALMLALYRAGRQADALAAYGRVRSLLVDELGAEPTPALRAVHELVLRQSDVAPESVSVPLHAEIARTSANRGPARRSRTPVSYTHLTLPTTERV